MNNNVAPNQFLPVKASGNDPTPAPPAHGPAPIQPGAYTQMPQAPKTESGPARITHGGKH